MLKKCVILIFSLFLLTLLVIPVQAQGSVTVMGVWTGGEADAFQKMVAPFEEETGIKVEFTGTRDLPAILTTRVEAGNPPDVSAMPNPGQMVEFAKEGRLVPLATFMDRETLLDNYSNAWLDLGSYDGQLYSIFISADLKSMVWYSPKAFAAAGYEVPGTWDELMALSDQMVADGNTPWAIGLESGAASGWPGTDWIEDIMLRVASPETYDAWVNHEIAWTNEAVTEAFELFGKIARSNEYVYGGPNAVLTIPFGDSADALFTDPPNAYMHRQATFIKGFILEHFPDLVPGEDFDFFPFPAIKEEFGTPALGAADMLAMFNDTPEARAFMEYIASAQAQEIWVGELGKLAPNQNVDPSVYPDDVTRKAADFLGAASVFRFDGSDLMPAAVGSGSFWTGILDYVSGENLTNVLMQIEASALDAYRD
ncbi:MAG: ABC transporter substrate-binding protein [Atribacterota bacterium]|jgi:alpha-glucoside transport system substrate-binding protein|nr:ABC transporter substrate-binding protein [Atribacterota bacterium]MDD3031114.1 ABC transporter substrate-binding protein [Atribacterota bacterium]MDD4288415.1 ABC transporter substrate-binding protein [Atribacterota bacterium]